VDHERFAERAARRLEMVADRLEEERRQYGTEGDDATTRAKELRVAAHLVRAESEVVSRSEGESPEDPMTSLGHEPLEAQT
jgi:VIT1/CCC1 family predicted Fe2+/Mn2+ transporter